MSVSDKEAWSIARWNFLFGVVCGIVGTEVVILLREMLK